MTSKEVQKPLQPLSIRSVDQSSSTTGASEVHSPWVSLDPKPENFKPPPVNLGDKRTRDTDGEMEQSIGEDGHNNLQHLPSWIQPYTNPMKASLVMDTFYGSLRSVSEFLLPKNFSKPSVTEALQRLKYNGKYFWANYCTLFAIITIISVITNPTLLIVIIIFTFMWSKVFDDNFTLVKQKIGRKKKTAFVGALSILGLVYFASGVIFWSLGSSVFLAATHASFHLPLGEDTTEQLDDDLELGFLEN